MAFFTGAGASAGAPGTIDSAVKNTVGAVQPGSDGGEYVYAKGVASTVAGSVVTIGIGGQTALLTVTATGPVAISTAATGANTWGWYQISGWNSTCLAGSNGTIVSGGGYLQCAEASEGTGRVCLGVSAGAGNFIFGMFSYSGQPDSDSAAADTPGADMITVYMNRPIATKNY